MVEVVEVAVAVASFLFFYFFFFTVDPRRHRGTQKFDW